MSCKVFTRVTCDVDDCHVSEEIEHGSGAKNVRVHPVTVKGAAIIASIERCWPKREKPE